MDGERIVQVAAAGRHGGGAAASCEGATRSGHSSGYGPFWRLVGARPLAKELLVVHGGRHGGGGGEGVLVLRTRQGWLSRIVKGAAALAEKGAWIPVGGGFCWAIGKYY